jgi:LysM repeat protein
MFVLGLAVLAALPLRLQAAPTQNLLVNPSFEGDYYLWQGDDQVIIAQGWQAWFAQPSEPPCHKFQPRYQGAAPYAERIHHGADAQQYYTFSASHIAGVYQQVNAPAGAIARFTMWGQSWTAPEDGDPRHSDPNNPMRLRIGIDPTGGTNPFSSAMVWSGMSSAHDAYVQFRVEATVGSAGRVTVFSYSNPEYCLANNNVYWDDASLTVIGQSGPTPAPTRTPGPTNTAGPTPTAGPTEPPPPTATPRAGGDITYVVQDGDTLTSIALQFNTTVAELQRLNDLGDSTLIYSGQELIVAESTAPPTATVVLPSATPLPTQPPPTPLPPAATALPGGSICVSAFDDTNGNGLRDAGEDLLAGTTWELLQDGQSMGQYETVGANEPYCFAELAAGTYTVRGREPQGSRTTTDVEWSVALAGGRNESVSLGATTAQPAAQPTQETNGGLLQQLGNSLWRASGILVLLAAVGIAGFIFLSRRT